MILNSIEDCDLALDQIRKREHEAKTSRAYHSEGWLDRRLKQLSDRRGQVLRRRIELQSPELFPPLPAPPRLRFATAQL